MSYLDRKRAELLMENAGLDALVLFSPESFKYATGANAGVATMWRQAGAVAVVLPAAANEPETAVISDLFADDFSRNSAVRDVREIPIWVETATLDSIDNALSASEQIKISWQSTNRVDEFNRPTTFNPVDCYRHVAEALSERGLSNGRIGIEATAVSVADYPVMQSVLGTELIDATDVINQLKMVKTAEEIENLRQAVGLAEIGMTAIRDAVRAGISRNELASVWQSSIDEHKQNISLTGSWEYISVGPNPWGGNAVTQPGDLVKVDVGCLVDGYTSDSARTFCVGQPSSTQAQVFTALISGFKAGTNLLKPGTALSELHQVTTNAIRAAGFPGYTRGHFGHGLGASVGSEQWPFIAADSSVIFEEGMVMAFECPWYINGLGGMIIENQLLITNNGHEMMNTMPLELFCAS